MNIPWKAVSICLALPLFAVCAKGADAMRSVMIQSQLDDFSQAAYSKSVESLFEAYEREDGKKIAPAEKRKVGIKIYTNSGPGISTPIPLVRAVIAELVKRGYKKQDICIADLNRLKLRDAGFLPRYVSLLEGVADDFEGSPVIDLDSGKYFHKDWFYDNPLMPRTLKFDKNYTSQSEIEGRKSYLPVPLFLTVDFWINLPAVTDIEGLGVNGAIANATIWNMSNSERFITAPANAPIAAAESAAIPELRDSLIFTIMPFETLQYVGGPLFNAAYTMSAKDLILSANPAVLDYIALDHINVHRARKGFETISPLPAIFEYAQQLDIGDYQPSKIKRINADKKN
jgi:hypothetical protein